MGMKFSLVAALAHAPRLLILDEATSGLDPVVRDDILDELLAFVGDESRSVLFSSHITSDLQKVADYITFVQNGKVTLTEKKDSLIYDYGIMRCTAAQFAQLNPADMLAHRRLPYQVDVLVASKKAAQAKYSGIQIDNAGIEAIMLLLVKGRNVVEVAK